MKKLHKYLFLFIILFLFSFIYTFFVHKNKIFPYQIIKKVVNPILYYINEIDEDDLLRDKYINWNDLNKNNISSKPIFLKEYYPGLNIYTDRNYFNHINDKMLKRFSMIQLPKHFKKLVVINLIKPNEIYIYRALCKHNDNKKYDNWIKAEFDILIISKTCIHNKLVKKKFKNGEIKLHPGGPKSSDPIFLSLKKSDIKIILKNDYNY